LIDDDIHNITETIHKKYNHTIMRTGFLKSTFGTLAMTGGGGLIFLYFSNRQFYDVYLPILGAFFILLGFVIYYAGDIYNINQSRDIENLRMTRASSLIDKKIEEEQERLAEEIVAKAEAKKRIIDIDTAKQMQNIRDGLCGEVRKLSNNKDELTYCSAHNGNRQLEYIRYPDRFPVEQILEVGMEKFKEKGEDIAPRSLKMYCKDLYDVGLISKKKLIECEQRLDDIVPLEN
jgi:hypothetical protein